MRSLIVAAGCLAAAPLVLAYVDGPLPGMTAGFGEPSCRSCHFDKPLNERPGRLELRGVPPAYTPGREYLITVRLSSPELHRGGFELSSRFSRGPAVGQQAGTLVARDERVRLIASPDGKLQYAQHTRPGSKPTVEETSEWTVAWTAPLLAVGPVTFHVAANASNADDSPLGDRIYLAESTSAAPSARR